MGAWSNDARFPKALGYGMAWNPANFAQVQTDCRTEIQSTGLNTAFRHPATGSILAAEGYTQYGTFCWAWFQFIVFAFTMPAGVRGNITSVRFRAQGYGTSLSHPTGNSSYETGPFQSWPASDFGLSLNLVVLPLSSPYPIQSSGVLMNTPPSLSIPFSTMNTANAAAGHVFSIQNNALIAPGITELTNYIDADALKNILNGLSSDSFLVYTAIAWPAGNFPYFAGPAANSANDFQEMVFFDAPQFLLST